MIEGSDWGSEPSRFERSESPDPSAGRHLRASAGRGCPNGRTAPFGLIRGVRPMFAAGDDQHLVRQSTGGQIFDQGRECVIGGGPRNASFDHRRVVLVSVHVIQTKLVGVRPRSEANERARSKRREVSAVGELARQGNERPIKGVKP